MIKEKVQKNITLDDLAMMVARGFDEVHGKLAKMATRDGLAELRSEVNDRFERVDTRIDRMQDDLRVIKTTLERTLPDHERRITRLEARAA